MVDFQIVYFLGDQEIQLQSQEIYLGAMLDGAGEGVISEHVKLNGRGA